MSAPERVGVIAARLLAHLAAPPDPARAVTTAHPDNRTRQETEMTVHTRTHVYVTFANPHLICDECRQPVPSWHDPKRCGCDEPGWRNQPCGHKAGVSSACASWNPVDGCQCLEHLGHVPHAPAEEQR